MRRDKDGLAPPPSLKTQLKKLLIISKEFEEIISFLFYKIFYFKRYRDKKSEFLSEEFY